MNKLLAAVILLMIFSSCKKEEFDYTSPSEYLTGGGTKNWFLKELYIDDELQDLDKCAEDDTLKLSANTSFEVTEGDSVCNSFKYLPNSEGEWRVSSDDKIFYLFGINAIGYEGRIVSMSSSKFEFKHTEFEEEYKYVYETK